MVVRCAVSKCTMTTDQAKNKNLNITFHRFPKDETFQLEWVKRCGRQVNASTARLCSLHFQKRDFDKSRDFRNKLMGTKIQRLLKKTAIPTINIHEEILLEKQITNYMTPKKLLSYSIDNKLHNSINYNKNLVEDIIQRKPVECLSDITVSPEATASRNTGCIKKLFLEEITKLCRLCLEEKPTMWSFFSLVTFDNGNIIDVSQAFQTLTREETDKMENPYLPSYICEHCLDLLTSASTFQQKYEQSAKILNDYLSRNSIKDVNIPIDEQDIRKGGKAIKNADETITPMFEFISTEEDNITHINTSPETQFKVVEPKKYSVTHKSLSSMNEIENINDVIATCVTEEDDTASRGAEEIYTSTIAEETITLAVTKDISIKLHRCPICPHEFTAFELKKHCRTHNSFRTYLKSAPKYRKKVKFYAKPRTDNKGLFNQEKIVHTCPFCQEEFESLPFRDHIKQHRTEGNFRCNICNRIFLGINHLKIHQLRSHKKEAPFKCKVCDKSFFVRKNYDFHLLKHSDDNELPFKCNYCPKTFSNPEHLKRHRFNHENDVAYHIFYKREKIYVKCKQCLQRFKTEEEKKAHNCRLCCAKCHKIFDSKSKFNSHVCKSKLKRSQCPPCGKVFLLPSSLKTHKFRCKTSTLCYVCGKNVVNITQHMLTHYPNRRGKSVFKCAQCEKQFSLKQYLKRHIAEVHLNIVHFRCQYCSKGFKSKWNLEVHERIHLGVKAHVCTICEKGFLEKSYLKKHLRIHMRQETFANPCEV